MATWVKNRNKPGSIIKLLVGLSVIVLLFVIADIQQIISTVTSSDPFTYLLAAFVFLLIYPLAALRWKILMDDTRNQISFSESIKVIAMSYGFNKILPLNSGDIVRSKLHEEYGEIDNHGSILGTVAVERGLDVVVISLVLAATGGSYLQSLFESSLLAFLPLIVVLTGFASVIIFQERYITLLDFMKNYMPKSIPEFGKNMVESAGSLAYFTAAKAFFLTSLRWAVDIGSLYLIGMAAGIPLSLTVAGFATAIMNIFALMPISPAGIGPVEASGTGALVASGIAYSSALSIVILKRGLGLLLMGLIGSLLYLKEIGR